VHELKVPTRRISVDVVLSGGAWTTGYMFHPESLYQTGCPGDIAAEMNDDRQFVPFQAADQATGNTLLSKRHIVRVRVHGLSVPDLEPGETVELERAQPCCLLFDDGTRLTGRPVIESQRPAARIVDRLNDAPVFWPLVTDEGIELINTRRIVRVFLDPI
jgi:hypothetical protein